MDKISINALLQAEFENIPGQIEDFYTFKKKTFLSKLAK